MPYRKRYFKAHWIRKIMGRAENWNDEWLINNVLNYSSYSEAVKAYNKIFKKNLTTAAIKNHCKYKLNINKPKQYNYYTEEETKWLMENYPKLGINETLKQYNEIFENKRTRNAIHCFGALRCDNVSKDVATANKRRSIESGTSRNTKPIGSMRIESGRWIIKTDNGWKLASRVLYEQRHGKLDKNMIIVALDNNCLNLDDDNLVAIPLKYAGLLSNYKLRSENQFISKTGIKWCELYYALKESEKKVEKM